MSRELDIPDSRLDTDGGRALAVAVAALASVLPKVGGVVSAVASGYMVGRKLGRVAETVDFLRNELGELRADIDETYVGSEDFEELLEEALLKAARERSESKRRAYARILARDLQNPLAQPYDAKLRILVKLEPLQEGHLRILAEIAQAAPEKDPKDGGEGDATARLAASLGESEESVARLLEDLRQEGLVEPEGLWGGGLVPKNVLTDLGRRIVSYLAPAPLGETRPSDG